MIASVAEMKLASDNGFARKLVEHSLPLRHTRTEVLQINVGKLCNLTCIHCHVNAGPKRKEIMTRETIDRVIDWLAKTDIPTVDLTGGAPEMIPDFKYLVERLKALTPPRHIIDRCNLTILLEPGFEDYAQFLARHRDRDHRLDAVLLARERQRPAGRRRLRWQHQGVAAFEFVRLRDRSRAPASSRLQSERCLSSRPAGGVGSRLQTRVERPFRNRL